MKQSGILICLLSIFLCSCAKPAILFLDPASEAYFQWQGASRADFEAAAGRAGYNLRVWPLDPKTSAATQLDEAWKQGGSPQTVLIYPPLMINEATLGLKRFKAEATIILKNGSGDKTDSNESLAVLEIDRSPVFFELGKKTAEWLERQAARKARCLFLTNTPSRQKELDYLWKGFSTQAGPLDRFQVQRWDLLPGTDGLRLASDQLQLEPNTLLLLFIDNANADFYLNLKAWKGHLVSEQLGNFGEKMGNVVASVDFSWDSILQKLLEKTNNQANKSTLKPNSLVELHLYTEYLNK